MPFFGVPIRNGLPIGLGSVAGFGVQQFDPSQLFAAGEQGFLYDPSDLSTLFQDSAGTTPVSGVGQVVGLMLDKSGNANNATSTGAARPTLSARVNRLERTEEISNAYWTKTQLASFAASGVTPNGVTAFNLVPNTNVDSHRLSRSVINIAGPKTMRVVAKANGYNFLSITDLTTFSAGIDLTTGTQWGGAGTAVITSLGNGWWEIKVSGTATASTSFAVEPLLSASFLAYAGDGVSGVLVGEFDDRFTNDGVGIPAYQRVNTATDYDSSGFPLYLRFGGTRAMSTGSIDFTATDKMSVFAGVRKLSDATVGVVAELSSSAGSGSNAGTFILHTQTSPVGYRYAAGSGASGAAFATDDVSTFTSPISNVITGTSDFAGATIANEIGVRVNGVVPTQAIAGTVSTGNFGNYPLFIGARNLANLFLNGRIYSLIGVGSAVSAGNISATESWVNGKTKAY